MAVTMVCRNEGRVSRNQIGLHLRRFFVGLPYVLVEGAKSSSCNMLGGPASSISNAGVLQYDNRRIFDHLHHRQFCRHPAREMIHGEAEDTIQLIIFEKQVSRTCTEPHDLLVVKAQLIEAVSSFSPRRLGRLA